MGGTTNYGKAESAKSRAVVIGSGPNGMAAAILLARAGWSVTVHERASTIGGGARTGELTLPGFHHDVCSSIHPMAADSPCFEKFPLGDHGLEWIQPDAPCAHPLDDGTAVMQERFVDATASNLAEDGDAWRRLMEPIVAAWPAMRSDVLRMPHIPHHPLAMARFGLRALRSAGGLADAHFRGVRARALWAGIAAHSVMPFEARGSAAPGLALAVVGHASGWPLARGGAQRISDALASYLRSLGGDVLTDSPVSTLPDAPLVMCDLSPRPFIQIAGTRMPADFRRSLEQFRYGPGTFKVDWALDGPIPWRARDCLRAGTVHVGGTFEEIAAWERGEGSRPFVLVTQPSLFDSSRAPAGMHTAWGYCHVPNGSTADMTEAIESQIERFAPGFRDRILARHMFSAAQFEHYNANYIGGDINGGVQDI